MATLGIATVAGVGTVGNSTAGGHLAAATISATGSVRYGGHLADAILAAIGTTTGTGGRTGSLSVPLGQCLPTASGAIVLTGASAVTLAACLCDGRSGSDCYLTATGIVINNLNGGQLQDCQFGASGQVLIAGDYSATTDDATLAADGSPLADLTGDLSITLDDCTLSATGENPDHDHDHDHDGGHGKKHHHHHRKRRAFVEIDGELFEVSSQEEAQELFKRARETAAETAIVASVIPGPKPEAPKIKVAEKSIDISFLQGMIDDTNTQIQQIYDAAYEAAAQERLKAEAEDDEAAVFLLLH